MVKRWVDFYKAHRAILDSDLIHLRRADGRDWDGWLHVNATGAERGLAMFYNPLAQEMERRIRLPLYYAGLNEKVRIEREDGSSQEVRLERDYSTEVNVKIPARGRTWLAIKEP